jgi:transcriptional regulator GlxA family with amidase domain
VIAWTRADIDRGDVNALRQRVGQSLRMFHRHCLEHIDTTPARLLEKLRVEQARTLLTTTSMPAKAIAAAAGLENPTNVEGSQSSRDMSLDRLSWNEFATVRLSI